MTRSPTVLHVLGQNPNKRGIVELQMIEMSAQFTSRGWQMICCFNRDAPPWLHESMDKVGGQVTWLPDPGQASAEAVVGLAVAAQADIVHLHFLPLRPLVTVLTAAGFRNLVVTEHSYRPVDYRYPARAIVRHFQSKGISRFIAVSRAMARQVKRDFLIFDRRIQTILNGVRLDYFTPRQDKDRLRAKWFGVDASAPVIAVAAHLHPLKRLDILVRAMPQILSELPEAHLVIAGGGPDEARLVRLTHELSLNDSVHFLTGDNRVEEIYAAADVGALLSSGEGMPGGAIEAMACGLPLVAAPRGGLREVPEHGVSGLLVHDQTPSGFAAAVMPLLKSTPLRREMGRAARLRAEQEFDVRRTARETLALYAELLHIH